MIDDRQFYLSLKFSDVRGDIIKFINQKNKSSGCPVCGARSFKIQEGFMLSPTNNKFVTLEATNDIFPKVAFVCNNCSFIEEFSVFAILRQINHGNSSVRRGQ